MNRIKAGLVAGVVFGILDIVPMFFLKFADPVAAIAGAFADRFAIGLLVFASDLGVRPWLRGVIIGALVSLPSALITKQYAPILGVGIVGGLILGWVAGRLERPMP